jgi:S-adenosylmethionine hydrolase
MNGNIVFQSDFGLTDGAVSAMQGVALGICPELRLFNLTHDIEPYNIWQASYRLFQTVEYWAPGTVFVSVVDPGVGTDRRSVAAHTRNGHYIVTPDNGTLTHLKRYVGIDAIREISPAHRRENSQASYTFHGRDLYAIAGAKLASGQIAFEEVGPELSIQRIVELPVGEVKVLEGSVTGCIDILDVRFGSLWTNIERKQFETLNIVPGERAQITIFNGRALVYRNQIHYTRSFGDVFVGEPLLYVNSLDRMAVAINQGNFAKAYNIGTGINWILTCEKV